MKIVLSLSGGMDSGTMLSYYLSKGYEVHPVNFTYGSKHNKYEQKCAHDLCEYYGISMELPSINLGFIGDLFKSDLLKSGGDIPEGHYEDENMKATVVPGRNLIFASILAGYAESIGADTIALGVHSGDHCIPGSEVVTTISGKKTVDELEEGTLVLSFNKKDNIISFHPITKKINVGFREDIYEINCKGGRNIRLTGNHKVYQVIRSNYNKHKGWDKEIIETPVEQLQPGDWVLTPCSDRKLVRFPSSEQKYDIDLLNFCDMNHPQLKYDNESIWFKSTNKVKRFVNNDEILKLLGWFITEGCRGSGTTKRANSYRTLICQSQKINPKWYNDIRNIIINWGFNPTDNKEGIYFSGPTTQIFELCGKYSENKKIPEQFIFMNPELLFEILIKGDGCITTSKYNSKTIQYGTKSSYLKEQVCWLATMLGFSVSVNIKKETEVFSIQMRRNFKKQMNKIGDCRMIQINEINQSKPEVTYDLTVDNNHNFFAGTGSGILVSNSVYPDCRPEFINSLKETINKSSDGKINVLAPFLNLDKTGILKIGYRLPKKFQTPYQLTRTCYKDQEDSCGKCGSCVERLEAFKNIKKMDPIKYSK